MPSSARCVARPEAVEQLGAELCPRARGEALANEIRSAIELVSSGASSALASQMLQLGERTAQLVGARELLPRPATLDLLASGLDAAQSRVVEKGGDYRRAFDRLLGDGARELRRRVVAEKAELGERGSELLPLLQRSLRDRTERVAHLGAVIDARDFRSQGWAFVSDKAGKAIAAVADLAVGGSVRLRFTDGEAAATVNEIQRQKGEPQ